MQQIAQLLKTALGNPCIEGKLADPIDCSVSDVTNYLKPNQMETVLPQCNATASVKPCWRIIADPVKCPDDMDPNTPPTGNYILDVQRSEAPPPDTHMIAYCVTEA